MKGSPQLRIASRMPTNRLTDTAIRALKPAQTPFKVSDGEGLHLLLQPRGGRLWRLSYRYQGRQKTLALGGYPNVTLAKARAAREAAKKLLLSGTDPSTARKADKQPASQSKDRTFGAIAERWFNVRKGKWTAGYAARVLSRVNADLIRPLGTMDIETVDSPDVLKALREIEARSAIEMAHRVRQYANGIFRFAKAEKLIRANPVEDLVDALASSPRKEHRASLKAREMSAFVRGLRAYDGEPRTRLALQLTLLTLVRTSEVRFARWNEFEGLDGLDPLWRLPAERMKMRIEHLVPLSRQAVATLLEIRPLAARSELLFPSPTKSLVISENTMLFALYRMGYHSRATVHGFRGTASTTLNENGFNRDHIERQLAHIEKDQVRAAYNSAEWLPKRRAMMQWWADWVDTQGGR